MPLIPRHAAERPAPSPTSPQVLSMQRSSSLCPSSLPHRAPPALSRGRLQAAIGLAVICLAGAAQASPQQADAPEGGASATDLDTVLVVGQRANRVSNGATNLDLAIKETPQSISMVSSEQMRQFGTDSLNEALRLATGIQVEEWETNRTNFTARGFDIANTQIDGVGLPNSWGIVTGTQDTFGYEKLEVIRGANGLLNTRGELFISEARHIPPELPRLSGPHGTEAEVARRYLAAQGQLIEAGMRLTAEAFGAMTHDLRAVADDCCGGRLLALAEGGYDLKALRDSLQQVIAALGPAERPSIKWPEPGDDAPRRGRAGVTWSARLTSLARWTAPASS